MGLTFHLSNPHLDPAAQKEEGNYKSGLNSYMTICKAIRALLKKRNYYTLKYKPLIIIPIELFCFNPSKRVILTHKKTNIILRFI